MLQEILTYLVVIWAFWQVFLFFWRIFKPQGQAHTCGSGGCGSCSAKTELLQSIKKGKYPTLIQKD